MVSKSQYENNDNALTEVALALSMAFFSIMILSIFTLSNTSLNQKEKISIVEGNTSKSIDKKKLIKIYFYNDNFFNENLKIIKNFKNIKENKILLLIPSDITVEKLFYIKSLTQFKNVKISRLSNNIKKLITSKITKGEDNEV